MSSSESELSESDVELQNAFAEGKLQPGLNIKQETPKQYINSVLGLQQKLSEIKLKLHWVELLDCTNNLAPLAPELAALTESQEQKRANELKNNKKLPQFAPENDPVLNDFKRETMFYRQAQATVLEAIPRLKQLNIATKRPDDYFAEMAKTDDHMQKVRETLMKKQEQQKRSERVKELRAQRKEGKMLQAQIKLQKQKEKREILDQVKKVRKGINKNFDFLDDKKSSKKSLQKRKMKDQKFGLGGKKRGLKRNNKESADDISEYRPMRGGKLNKKGKSAQKRPGKNRRIKNKTRNKK